MQLAVSIVGTAAYLFVPVSAPIPGLVGGVALPLVVALGVPAAVLPLVAERSGGRLSARVQKRA